MFTPGTRISQLTFNVIEGDVLKSVRVRDCIVTKVKRNTDFCVTFPNDEDRTDLDISRLSVTDYQLYR